MFKRYLAARKLSRRIDAAHEACCHTLAYLAKRHKWQAFVAGVKLQAALCELETVTKRNGSAQVRLCRLTESLRRIA